MTNISKSLLIIIAAFMFSISGALLAQEPTSTSDTTTPDTTIASEEIKAEELEVKEPQLLPDSPFYFLKNWGRNIQSFFTFNKVKKLELKEKFANEKLIEVKKMAEKKSAPQLLDKAIENYKKEIEKVKEQAEKIEEKAKDNPQLDSFLDKFTKQQALHQEILQKLENQVPPEVFAKIKEAREKHLEKFGQVMQKLEDKEKIGKRLEKNLQEGTALKNFKELEILKNLEEKLPEEIKEKVKEAEAKIQENLKTKLENMSEEEQNKLKEKIERLEGNKEKYLEIIENLRNEIKDNPALQNKLDTLNKLREKMLEKVEQKNEKKNCPVAEKPAADFCKNGRIIPQKDKNGCITSFKCVVPQDIKTRIPEETKACITLWDPVCGKDGKTYSNECFANLAGVKIDYKGECKESSTPTSRKEEGNLRP
jgi:hypothetical protein